MKNKNAPGGLVPTLRGQILCTGIFHLVPNILIQHRIVTAAQMKEIERSGDAHGLPYLQMMENAGLAAYAELQKQFPHPGRLLVVCGKGNNGGDGFVIARAAAKDGWM